LGAAESGCAPEGECSLPDTTGSPADRDSHVDSPIAESGHQDPQQESQFILDIALVDCFLYLNPQRFAEPASRPVERRAKRLARTRTSRPIGW
jgi:hypothetical protein